MPFLSLLVCTVWPLNLTAQWQPSGHTQNAIWPATPPDARKPLAPESFKTGEGRIGGKPVTGVYNVSIPTITVYQPKINRIHPAVLVFPGGGYQGLAIDLEGTEVCDWLNSIGITGVLLKYRVPAPRSAPYWGAYPQSRMALEDAQRAIRLVRFHAGEWGIDPHKIGVVGFSAGGHLVAAVSTNFEKRIYKPVDSIDRQSDRPDFAMALYPGHLWLDRKRKMNPYVPVTKRTPPTFIVQAKDDPVDPVRNSIVYYRALKNAGVPLEMHLFDHGGHAFGLRPTKFPITQWPLLAEAWLKRIHVISRQITF